MTELLDKVELHVHLTDRRLRILRSIQPGDILFLREGWSCYYDDNVRCIFSLKESTRHSGSSVHLSETCPLMVISMNELQGTWFARVMILKNSQIWSFLNPEVISDAFDVQPVRSPDASLSSKSSLDGRSSKIDRKVSFWTFILALAVVLLLLFLF